MTEQQALAKRIDALETRLAAVEAVQEIHRLKARYGSLIDERYTLDGPREPDEVARIADAVTALFVPDAVWDGGDKLGIWTGRDEIRKRFLEPTLEFTLHYFLKPVIEVDPNDANLAAGRWDILAPITFAGGRPGWMAGVEHDAYRRHEGRWLHSRMRLDVIFMGPDLRGWDRRPRS